MKKGKNKWLHNINKNFLKIFNYVCGHLYLTKNNAQLCRCNIFKYISLFCISFIQLYRSILILQFDLMLKQAHLVFFILLLFLLLLIFCFVLLLIVGSTRFSARARLIIIHQKDILSICVYLCFPQPFCLTSFFRIFLSQCKSNY